MTKLPTDRVGLVWFDPGPHTGAVSLLCDASWLAGRGRGEFEGLGAALSRVGHAHLGRENIFWNTESGRKVPLSDYWGEGTRSWPKWQHAVPTSWQREDLSVAAQGFGYLKTLGATLPWGHEDFLVRSSDAARDTVAPLRIAAMLTALEVLEGEGRHPFVQSSSLAKTTVTDERLKAAGMHRRGLGHANDAARHALLFLRRARSDRALRAQAWPHVPWDLM